MSKFGNLFSAMGIGQNKAVSMSENLVKLASDLAVFNHIDPTVATDKLMSALTGLPRPLKELGISFTEDDVKAKALQMGLISAAVSMDDVNNATNRLKIAQMELADAQQGGGVNADKVASAQDRVAKATEAVQVAQTNLERKERDLDVLMQNKNYTALQVAHAEEAVADAHRRVEDATNAVADAQNNLTKAQAPVGPDATRVASAQEKVAEAEQKVTAALSGQVGSLDDATKAQATYALIMEQSKNATGAFSKNSNDLSVQLMILKANWEDVLQLLSQQLIPIVTAAVKVLNSLLEWFKEQPKWVRSFVLSLATVAAVIGPLLVVLSIIGNFASGIVGLVGLLGGSAGLSAGIGVLGTAFSGLATTIGTMVLPALAELLIGTAEIWVPLLLLAGVVYLVYLAFKNNFMGITTAAQQLWFILKYEFTQGWANLVASTQAGMADMGASMQAGTEGAQNIFQGFMNWMEAAWRNLVTAVGGYAAWARDRIISPFNVNWAQVGANIIQGIINGFLSGLSSLIAAAEKAAESILGTFDNVLNSHSPSMEMYKRGCGPARVI